MRQTKKEERRIEIENAAYEILEKQGVQGFSMAAIAKQAKASMETLYRWYGDKNGLYSALVVRNSQEVLAILEAAEALEISPREKLRTTAVALLSMLSSSKAIALNRAAIEDKTRTLGPLLSNSGRSVVGPRLAKLILAWRESGALDFADPKEATLVFINLLVGDHQVQRASGAAPVFGEEEINQRVDKAMAYFERVFAP